MTKYSSDDQPYSFNAFSEGGNGIGKLNAFVSASEKKEQVDIKATVRIISTVKRKLLNPTEAFYVTIHLPKWMCDNEVILKVQCETYLRLAYVDHFLNLMKKNHLLRHSVGGIAWSVDPANIEYTVIKEEMP